MSTYQRITTSAVVAISLAAAGAPGVSAMPIGGGIGLSASPVNGQPTAAYSRPDKSLVATDNVATATPVDVASLSTPKPAASVTSPNGSFDWGDAGIGAAGGLLLSLAGFGGTFAIFQRRRIRRTNRTAAVTG